MKIKQIIAPSERWIAAFKRELYKPDQSYEVICWALTEDGDVVGLIALEGGEVVDAPSWKQFVGYVFAGEADE